MCFVPFQRGESRITTSRLETGAPLIPCLRAASCTIPAAADATAGVSIGGTNLGETLHTWYKLAMCPGQMSPATSSGIGLARGEHCPTRPSMKLGSLGVWEFEASVGKVLKTQERRC